MSDAADPSGRGTMDLGGFLAAVAVFAAKLRSEEEGLGLPDCSASGAGRDRGGAAPPTQGKKAQDGGGSSGEESFEIEEDSQTANIEVPNAEEDDYW